MRADISDADRTRTEAGLRALPPRPGKPLGALGYGREFEGQELAASTTWQLPTLSGHL